MLQLYFIRHGQSTNNVIMEETGFHEYLVEREPEPDLTPTGFDQANLTGKYLARPLKDHRFDPQNRDGFGLTHLYFWVMIRAIKTGQAIAKKTGLTLAAWPEAHETGGLFDVKMQDGEPVFNGMPGHGRDFFASEFPDLVIPEDLPQEGWWNREKEPRDKYRERAQAIIDCLVEEHGGQEHKVGIVTHGGIFARILSTLFDVQAERYWFLMNNCGISRLDIEDDGRFTLLYMNKVDHLPDHLIT